MSLPLFFPVTHTLLPLLERTQRFIAEDLMGVLRMLPAGLFQGLVWVLSRDLRQLLVRGSAVQPTGTTQPPVPRLLLGRGVKERSIAGAVALKSPQVKGDPGVA